MIMNNDGTYSTSSAVYRNGVENGVDNDKYKKNCKTKRRVLK